MDTKIHVPSLPLAANICDQLLREVTTNHLWTMAHVLMNPGAFSLLHKHEKMAEVYAITRGYGELVIGSHSYEVRAGSVIHISPQVPHQFFNTGATSLEHLVLAMPPFDPADVVIIESHGIRRHGVPFVFPPVVECFDGAKIMPYELQELDPSFAFGWVINDPSRRKSPHYHKRVTEYIFIVEGRGTIEIDGEIVPIESGDWVEIPPESAHVICNKEDQYMVALCICSPRFDMTDVFYR